MEKGVTVSIDRGELLRLFTRAVFPEAEASFGKERTLWRAFGNLVGISDVDAVKVANRETRKFDPNPETITTDEFRKWLPQVLSKFADDVLEGGGRAERNTNDLQRWAE